MGRYHLATCLLVAIALSVLPAFPTPPADALPEAVGLSVTVSLTPDTLTARITNSQDGPVLFGGNVTVGKLPANVQRVTVTLSASCVWDAVVSPDTMVFTDDRPHPFYLTVVVPSKTHVSSNVAIVNAHATDGYQSADGSARCTVVVGQYYKVTIGTDTPLFEISDSPTTIEGTLQVYNEGNGRDTFRLEVVDPPKGLADYDIDESVVVAADDSAEVGFTLFIELETGFREGAAIVVTFKATSMGAAGQGVDASQTYGMSVHRLPTGDKLARDLPTYIGWGVGLGVLGAVVVVMVRRRRRRRDELGK